MRSLLDITQLAEWLNIPVAAARQRRYRDPESMPPAIVLGTSLRWDPETVEKWLAEREEVRALARTSSEILNLPVGSSRGSR